MKSKRTPKTTKKDKEWQRKIEGRAKAEKVILDDPKGKEKFERIVRKLSRKKNT